MMDVLSFIDKLKILGDVAASSIFNIILIIIMALLLYLFIKKEDTIKKHSFLYFIVIAILIITILVIYASSLAKMFDYLIDNLFVIFYFPNLAAYLVGIIATNIIMWKGMFSYKLKKSIKAINSVVYVFMHYLLILILGIITTKKLDVFTWESVYQNKQSLALIEISSTLFIVWITFLIVYKLIRRYQDRKNFTIEKYSKNKTINNLYNLTVKKHIPNNINVTTLPSIVEKVDNKSKLSLTDEKEKNIYEDMLTVDDYKLIINLLLKSKNKKEQEVTFKTIDRVYANSKNKKKDKIDFKNIEKRVYKKANKNKGDNEEMIEQVEKIVKEKQIMIEQVSPIIEEPKKEEQINLYTYQAVKEEDGYKAKQHIFIPEAPEEKTAEDIKRENKISELLELYKES